MNTINQTQQISQLYAQGISIRKIAKQLGISKSSVHRTVSEIGTEVRDSTVPLSQQACTTGVPMQKQSILPLNNNNFNYKNSNNMENYDYQSMKEIEIRRLELEHEIQMKKLEMQEEELSLRSRELHLKSKQSDSDTKKQEQDERILTWELQEFFKDELESCEKFGKVTISLEDAEEKLDLLKSLQKKIVRHCTLYQLQFESLLFYINTQAAYKLLKKKVDAAYEDDDFDADDDEIEYFYNVQSRTLLKQLQTCKFDFTM